MEHRGHILLPAMMGRPPPPRRKIMISYERADEWRYYA
jgi:hypothetical protein